MKKVRILPKAAASAVVCLSLLLSSATVSARSVRPEKASAATSSASETSPLGITSQTAAVMDASGGQVLYAKDMHKKMYPASITKIMTGLVAVENASPESVVTVSREVQDIENGQVAHMALAAGEKITLDQALYGMFLASANDAAMAIAEHVSGSEGAFVSRMNDTAKALGASDTHFDNSNGLPDAQNYTSAYDMALIAKAAAANPVLMKYFGARSYDMAPTNLQPKKRHFETLHKMMQRTSRFYDADVIAGKTGWETMSGHTLVTVARRNGATLICVAMRGASDAATYNDTRSMLNFCFENYASLKAEAEAQAQSMAALAAAAETVTPKKITATNAAAKTAEANERPWLEGTVVLLAAAILLLFASLLLRKAVLNSSTRV